MEKSVEMERPQVEITFSYLSKDSGEEKTETHLIYKSLYEYIAAMRDKLDGRERELMVSYSLN